MTDETGKICPEYLWARVNAKFVASAIKDYMKDHPDKPVVAAHRIVVCREFKNLSDADQLEWKHRASEGRELRKVANAAPLEGEARIK